MSEITEASSNGNPAVVILPPSDESKIEKKAIGTVKASVLVLADTKEIDEHWQQIAGSGSYFVDITGDHARAIARRDSYPTEELADGTWRIKAPNSETAGILRESAIQYIGQQMWTGHSVRINYGGASTTRAIDATRKCGAGKAHGHEMAAIAIPSGKEVELIQVIGIDGEVAGYEIRFVIPRTI